VLHPAKSRDICDLGKLHFRRKLHGILNPAEQCIHCGDAVGDRDGACPCLTIHSAVQLDHLRKHLTCVGGLLSEDLGLLLLFGRPG